MSQHPRPRPSIWPLLAALLLCTAAGPAAADDSWSPFGGDSWNEPARRNKPIPPPPPASSDPLLRPMDSPDAPRGQWAGPGDRPSDQGGIPYGRPYAAPGDSAGDGWGADGGTRDTGMGAGPGGAARDSLPPAGRAERTPPPMPEPGTASRAPGAVERGDLTPVLAGDGSGLPLELWNGLDVKTVETLIARIEIPPRSPAVHDLWRRLVTANATPPTGEKLNAGFEGIRAEVLYRSGMLKEAAEVLAKARGEGADPVLAIMAARNDLAMGERERGCATAKAASAATAGVPKPLRAQEIEMLGYCAAAAGNPSAAGLAADLARDEGLASPELSLLDAVAAGSKPDVQRLKSISVVDYRLLELAKDAAGPHIVAHAQPALLAMLARDAGTPPAVRLAAAEAAARLNAITSATLAEAYRAVGEAGAADAALAGARDRPGGGTKATDAAHQRAAMFKAIEAERTPFKRTRLIRAFLDEARRNDFYLPALEIVARPAAELQMVPEIGWFAETAVEIALVAGDFPRARNWARFGSGLDRPGAQGGGGALAHWLALADVADPALPREERGRELPAVERLAVHGRFNADQLNRIATVLDALDYNVPMQLWEMASRSPQPAGGHLPATGVLSELQDASKKKQFGRTVLLAMDTLGPFGAEGANMIALGDSIRALRRAGLDKDARRLGLEALFPAWPRQVSN